MTTQKNNQQLGVIVFGNGMDHKVQIEEAKKRGFEVKVMDDHAQLWGDPKKLQKTQ